MVTLVWRTDVHLADKAPRSRIDDWASTVLDKLIQVGEIAGEVEADAVVDGGDFYHIKTPSRTTHALNRMVAEIHADYPCSVWGLTGNHDVKYGDMDYIHEAPLGVLFATGVFKPFGGEVDVTFQNSPEGPKVRLVGIPYHGKQYDMNRLTTITKGDEDYLVVAAHLLASQGGGEMFGSEDIIRYSDLVNLDPDVWMFGHWHQNQGVTELGGKHIVNIGSLTRGALSEDDMKRIPEVAILRFTDKGIDIERRELDVEPAEKVFDIEGRVQEEARGMTVDAFVESVKNTLSSQKQKSLLDEVRKMGLIDVVEERLIEYLEAEGVT